MSKSNQDFSIFTEVKNEVDALLSTLPYEQVLEAKLYVVNDEIIVKFRAFQQRLYMEYSYDENVLKKHKLSKIVKVLNFNAPSHSYKTKEDWSWEQVNDEDKVFARLDGAFAKYANKIKKNTKKKIRESPEAKLKENLIMRDIDKEIQENEKLKEWIKENFEKLDVRLSGYFEKSQYASIEYRINKKRVAPTSLRKTVPNVLWFKELEEDKKTREDNELKKYLSVATRAFGNVFFVEKSKYQRPKKKQKEEDEL